MHFFDNIDDSSILNPISSPQPMSSYSSSVLAQQLKKNSTDHLRMNEALDNNENREEINGNKKVFFRALPESPKPLPPPDPNSGNLVLFFGRQNSRFESPKKRFAKMWGGEGDKLTT